MRDILFEILLLSGTCFAQTNTVLKHQLIHPKINEVLARGGGKFTLTPALSHRMGD